MSEQEPEEFIDPFDRIGQPAEENPEITDQDRRLAENLKGSFWEELFKISQNLTPPSDESIDIVAAKVRERLAEPEMMYIGNRHIKKAYEEILVVLSAKIKNEGHPMPDITNIQSRAMVSCAIGYVNGELPPQAFLMQPLQPFPAPKHFKRDKKPKE